MEVNVKKVIPMPSSDPANRSAVNTWVIYEVDKKRTETVLVPKDKPTDQEIQAAIKAAEKSRSQLTGKTFKIE